MNQETIDRLKLILIPGVGHLLARHLVMQAGGASELFKLKLPELLTIPGLGEVVSRQILKHSDYETRALDELKFIKQHNVEVIFFDDLKFPYRLNECPDPPFVLFYKGTDCLNSNRMISIVGTRKATQYGKNFIHQICEDLRQYNVTVVSGLAYGVDIHAHRECINYQIPTIGVVAHGHDRIYPNVHKNTAKSMLSSGGILSEFFCHTNPDRENFPKRNRIIAGMTDATILVEAAEKGGALITGNLAFDYGRDVMALPGRRYDEYSKGCNNLIKQNKAHMITEPDDIPKLLGWGKKTNVIQTNIFDQMNDEQRKVMEVIRAGSSFVEDLCRSIQKSFSETKVLLFEMELNGWIKQLPGNRVELIQ